ncbi:polyprenyl synthetase family protein [Alicyclobacillus vulcanalis]|uniref:Geranylgeranyl diphosphate synthase, type I n=2 Tax=Alicyclobacillus TaxID=29330 RepID=A0A1N7LI64_9BACL|nr:polyprenyl synthetase family protein [Alicyclobacillus vulcanalis]SIS73489.1 geranylgeranyl diphosphate synthase, type I [Alicyclobacillus vulcanalis]
MPVSITAQDMLLALEDDLVRSTRAISDVQRDIGKMIEYHLGVGTMAARKTASHSKRIRPLLLLCAHAALGGEWRHALPAAVSLEYVHGFSLIHDDIEDRSPLRRGRASLWAVWGVDRALNAGDALFALAFRTLRNLSHHFEARLVIDVYDAVTQACLALSAGQELDLAFEQTEDVTTEAYLRMAELKTGALFGAALEVAAILAGQPARVREDLRQAGEKLGLLFQILDDFYDLFGEERELGKPVAQDAMRGKKTLPVVLGLHRDKEFAAMWRSLRDNRDILPHLRARLITEAIIREATAIEEHIRAELRALWDRAPFADAWKADLAEMIDHWVRRRR